jgi:decaprenylphospho-beta-D-erythro-pentofuranosid-2-ulose 2-reductase
MNKGSVLILGARSDIGMAVAHRFAREGYDIQLAARNVTTLNDDSTDIHIRHSVNVTVHEFDALNFRSHEEFLSILPELPIIAVSAIGYMGDQKKSEEDVEIMSLVMRSNYEGPASIIGILANHFEKRGSGTLIGISSVAGERGRASNYVYGSAKAGFTGFLSGLRNRLANKDVHVITVLPGFVNTKMTAKMTLLKPLTGNPSDLSEAIYRAFVKKKNRIYYLSIWQFILVIIRMIPERVFKYTKI